MKAASVMNELNQEPEWSLSLLYCRLLDLPATFTHLEKIVKSFFGLQVHLTLSETETIWLLDFPGTCVAEDSEIAEGIKDKNQRYEEV